MHARGGGKKVDGRGEKAKEGGEIRNGGVEEGRNGEGEGKLMRTNEEEFGKEKGKSKGGRRQKGK